MKRILYLVALSSAIWAQQPSELLTTVQNAYSKLSAVHVISTRTETISLPNGASAQSAADYELAETSGGKYLARIKGSENEALAVSDGSTTWKALPKQKQWMKLEAASVTDDDADAEDTDGDSAQQQPQDLHTRLENALLRRFPALAKSAHGAEFGKDETVKAGGGKIRCRVVSFEEAGAVHELWIDQQRGFVLQERQIGQKRLNGLIAKDEIVTKVKLLETNSEVPGDLFSFEPQRSWSQVDMLSLPGEENVSLAGRKAADFELKSLDGEHVDLASFRGKVVVLDFWATWCGPCRQELPIVDKLRQEFGEQVQFLGINEEENGTVKGFLHRNPYGITVLMDAKRSVNRIYGVHSIPTLVVIDKDGVIRQHFVGGRTEADLREAIAAVVRAPGGGE